MTQAKETVLLVDDEVKILSALSSILESSGFGVMTAADGREALSLLERHPADVVLLDLVMPGQDGLSVLQDIQARRPECPVIMLTGHGTISKAVEAIKAGAFDFLEKPVESKKILVTIANALRKSRLEQERRLLLDSVRDRYRMVGRSAALQEIMRLVEKIAPTHSRVLIMGESGVGKELVARAIHLGSERAGYSFQVVNCAAIPEELIESELFGHEKGAFTGAIQAKEGKFEQASGGTLFLDEIGDMSLKLQAKVLRAIEDGEIQRIGGTESMTIDTRIIAASNMDLKQAVRDKLFREDLYFRLSVIAIAIPPLRERREDIAPLVEHFMAVLSQEAKRPLPVLEGPALEALLEYPWPGNVRELRNFVEKAVVLYPGEAVSKETVLALLGDPSPEAPARRAVKLADIRKRAEKEALVIKLTANDWDYERTAEELGISRATLFNKIKEYEIKSKKLD